MAVRTPQASFTGDSVESDESITLPIEIGIYLRVRKLDMEFIVVCIS